MDSLTVFAWAILTYLAYAFALGMGLFWACWGVGLAFWSLRYALRRRQARQTSYEASILIFEDWPRGPYDDEPTSLMDDVARAEERRVH